MDKLLRSRINRRPMQCLFPCKLVPNCNSLQQRTTPLKHREREIAQHYREIALPPLVRERQLGTVLTIYTRCLII
eukprot:COSAG02_NODE_3845_length_6153_cov_3.206640_1_plen_75_part_00